MSTKQQINSFTRAAVKAIIFFCVCFTSNIPAQDWPMVNGSKERTSWAQFETVLNPPLQKTVEFTIDSGYASGMTYYDGMLFVSVEGDPNRVFAFEAENGNEVWRFEIPGTAGSVNLAPAVNDSILLCGGQHGLGLYAMNRLTGEEKWFKSVGTLYSRNPIIDSSRVYIIGDSLYCLDISNGATIWSFNFSASATPAIDDEKVYICGDRQVIALNKMNGEISWLKYNSNRNYAPIAVDDQFIYTSSNDSILALNKDSGTVHWAYISTHGILAGLFSGSMAISDSILCFSIWEDSAKKGQLHTLDKLTGSHLWQYIFDNYGTYTPVIANGYVYTANWMTSSIRGFDVQTGQDVFYDHSENYLGQPIVANNTLYVGALGKVIAFKNLSTGIHPIVSEKPIFYELFPAYPNPFNPGTTINFSLAKESNVSLKVFDLLGQEVSSLVNNQFMNAGSHSYKFDASTLASGTYIYRLEAGDFVQTMKMTLTK